MLQNSGSGHCESGEIANGLEPGRLVYEDVSADSE